MHEDDFFEPDPNTPVSDMAWGGPDFEDNVVPIREELADGSTRLIRATPFSIRPEADIPRREWLYGHHLLRRFVSVDVAAGGVGKSALKIGEALAIASGRQLYKPIVHDGPHRVWLFNLEDPHEETERRVHATAKRNNIPLDELIGRFWWDSGRDQRLVIASSSNAGVVIARPLVEDLIAVIKEERIDVMIVDPFVSSHEVTENDNGEIDIVVKEWARIAHECNCSINLVHHIRKQNGQEANAESSRGAVSLIAAARSVMVYNRMSKEEAATLSVSEDERRFFFRVENDKSNLAPPVAATWHRMNNVSLDNGDDIGVACAWTPPDPFAGVTTAHLMRIQKEIAAGNWRESPQAKAWAGIAVAGVLGLDTDDEKDKRRIKALIKTWIKEGVLEIVETLDEQRRPRPGIVVGNWVSE